MRPRRRSLQEQFLPEEQPTHQRAATKMPPTIEFKHVNLADLKIPTEIYQRSDTQRMVKKIVDEGWDTGLQIVLLVSAETNNILDGGTRALAAQKLGIIQLPAMVYHGLTLDDEARYFVALNQKRRPVGLKIRHHAKLQFGDPEAVEADNIMKVVAPKKIPLQTVVASNQRYPGVLSGIAPTLAQMDTHSFSRDFVAGVVHFANGHHGMSEAVRDRLKEPGMYRRITETIKRVMREHMQAHGRTALPTDWSVKAEGVELALTTRPALVPREPIELS